MSDKEYTPIPCAIYGRYEVAIMHRQPLRVRWHEPDGLSHCERLQPLDLITRNHEEFLIAEAGDGRRCRLRLDWIVAADEI